MPNRMMGMPCIFSCNRGSNGKCEFCGSNMSTENEAKRINTQKCTEVRIPRVEAIAKPTNIHRVNMTLGIIFCAVLVAKIWK